MKEILQFSLLGLGEGSLIAGVAIALVLFYRGSGVINLATGAIAMITGYAYWALTTGQFGFTFSTGPALVAAFLVAVAQGLIMEFGAFRPLRAAPPLAKLIATLGFFLFAQAAVLLAFGPDDKSEPAILPQGAVTIFGAPVGYDQLILAGIVIVVAAALAAVYRWTGFGIRTRASAENEVSAMYVGLFPQTLSLINTLMGSVIAGMLGVLAAPLITLNSTTFPLLVVPALAAALFARFTSFGIACAVGLALGAMQNVIYYLSTLSWFPTSNDTAIGGVNDLVIFLLIVLAMFWRGGKLPGRGDLVEQRLPEVPKATNIGRWALIAARGRRRRAHGVPLRPASGAHDVDDRRGPRAVARRHHRLRRPGVGRAARPVGRVRVRHVASHGEGRARLPARADHRRARSRRCSASSSRSGRCASAASSWRW